MYPSCQRGRSSSFGSRVHSIPASSGPYSRCGFSARSRFCIFRSRLAWTGLRVYISIKYNSMMGLPGLYIGSQSAEPIEV
nr:hypothetical protein Q903MT_gene1513 [Picea sitchensis]